MIEFTSVTKNFGSQTAVDAISFRVEEGTVCVLIGPSGCGKTTTLRMINRMIEPSSGDIVVRGKSIGDMPAEELRRGIGYVIQSIGLLPHLNVRDNISIVPRLLKWDKRRRYERAEELLKMIGLEPSIYCEKFPHQLSGGEAQRIGVARALAAKPDILLMDEPFGAIDPLRREALQTEFLALQRRLRKTVIFVTHDLDEAIRLADRILLMDKGTIVQYDTPEQILAHPINRFTRDFVGEDRALKRLACFSVQDYMRDSHIVSRDRMQGYDATMLNGDLLWIVDDRRQLLGMVRRVGAEIEYTEFDGVHLGVSPLATLRDALSRLLGHGLRAVPVIDGQNRVLGEVQLGEIEKINQSIAL